MYILLYTMIIFTININTNVDVYLNTDISAKTNNSSVVYHRLPIYAAY